MLGLGLSLTTGGVATPAYVVLAKAFVSRVEADGGTVESFACLKTDMAYLTSNPAAPAGYTVEWSAATVGSSAEFRINLVGGAGYAYTYAVTDSQATEVTGSGVMSGNIQAVVADLSTLVDGQVTLAVYLTGAGGNGNVVTDTANLVGYTGLLDTYSGAAAAYSLRLLDTSYTGSAVRVRRASDNAEQDIAFANNELDTATLETFASGTDAFVTTWYDQSGNANNATQATASKQPKIVSSGSTILQGGKPIITKTDNDSKLNTALVGTQNASFFGSFMCDNLSIILSQSATSANPYLGVARFADTGASEVNVGNISYYKNGTIISTPNRDTILSAYVTQSVGSIFIDDGLDFDTDGYALGYDSSSYSMYDMQEFIIYPNDQSTNRTGIETNINDFYSIY